MVDPRHLARLKDTGPFCRKCDRDIVQRQEPYPERGFVRIIGTCGCGTFTEDVPLPPPVPEIDYEALYEEEKRRGR